MTSGYKPDAVFLKVDQVTHKYSNRIQINETGAKPWCWVTNILNQAPNFMKRVTNFTKRVPKPLIGCQIPQNGRQYFIGLQ